MFGDLSGEVFSYIKTENLQPGNESDIVAVVKRYDFLMRGQTDMNSRGD